MPTALSNTFQVDITATPTYVPGEPWGYKVGNDGQGISQGGTFIDGGRGKDPIYVTNLDSSGSGSYASVVEGTTAGPVLFEVGGAVSQGSSGSINIASAAQGDKTIWGNTAPDRMNIHGTGGRHFIRTDNVIMKHIAVRLNVVSGNFDPISCYYEPGQGRFLQNVLIENCSFSYGSDNSGSIASDTAGRDDNHLANVTYYKCIFSHGLAEPHSDVSVPHNLHGILEHNRNAGYIECIFTHGRERPLIRAIGANASDSGTACLINCWRLLWSNGALWLSSSQIGGGNTYGKIILKNNVWRPEASIVAAYSGTFAPQPAPNKIATVSSLNGNTEIFWDGNENIDGMSTSQMSSYMTSDTSGWNFPDGYSSRLLTIAEMNDAWIDTIGASPSVPDIVDLDVRSAVKNPTNADTYVDVMADTPGMPSLTAKSHATRSGFTNVNTFGGDTLQQHLENKPWWGTRHVNADGYTNRTKLEVYLDTFVSGVPGVDPNL